MFKELNDYVGKIDLPDAVTRKQVGLRNVSPYVDGYWYLYIDLPKAMKDLGYNLETWRKLSAGLSVNFTPPTYNINKGDVQHLGGASKHASGGTKNNDFTITYNELSGAPIFKFHKLWTKLVFDGGLSLSNIELIPAEYKTTFLAILAKPVGGRAVNKNFKFTPEHIENVYLLVSVSPPDDPQDSAFNPDISSPQAGKQLSYSYQCDDWYDVTDIPELAKIAADILNNKIFKWTVFNDLQSIIKNQKFVGTLVNGSSS